MATQVAGRSKDARRRRREPTATTLFKVVAEGLGRVANAKDAAQTSYGRLWSPYGRSTNADVNAGLTGRRKKAFLPEKSLASLLRQSEISRYKVLGRCKDASPV
ncbi:hypothetical protein DPMN_079899 [Dreissena polymorpha]|uniref:Uncharacterized protein n=1 Tax=Dreissena polymorpha TaxID=45954 RepID=A0A9D4BRC2_DREPO|nr:hypothetical protein DPMN_079899 [Dreissena polymorpha]